jgi:hypothetical protein
MTKGKAKKIIIPTGIPQLAPKKVVPTFSALTNRYDGISHRIITNVKISTAFDPADYQGKPVPFQIIEKNALWDTGATNSVITAETAKQLNLTPVGSVLVNHAGGSSPSNTYLVNLVLPNQVGFAGVQVSECVDSEFGVIIGMDIICSGDFSITNVNQKTVMSFRNPSLKTIDYVTEINPQK